MLVFTFEFRERAKELFKHTLDALIVMIILSLVLLTVMYIDKLLKRIWIVIFFAVIFTAAKKLSSYHHRK